MTDKPDPATTLAAVLAALATAARAESRKVPFFAACGGWGHHRISGLVLAVADALPEAERAGLWQACGIAPPNPEQAQAIRDGQAAEG